MENKTQHKPKQRHYKRKPPLKHKNHLLRNRKEMPKMWPSHLQRGQSCGGHMGHRDGKCRAGWEGGKGKTGNRNAAAQHGGSFSCPRFEILDTNRKQQSCVKSAELCKYPNSKLNGGISLPPMCLNLMWLRKLKKAVRIWEGKLTLLIPAFPPNSIPSVGIILPVW